MWHVMLFPPGLGWGRGDGRKLGEFGASIQMHQGPLCMAAPQECSRTHKTAQVREIIPESALNFSPALSSSNGGVAWWGGRRAGGEGSPAGRACE